MIEETKTWLYERVSRDPRYLVTTVFPHLQALEDRKHAELHQALRENLPFEQVKYRQGALDGVQATLGLLNGLKLSETKKPSEPGLMARILRFGRTDGTED